MRSSPAVVAVSGVKNSGKTTLIEGMLPHLAAAGLSVAVVKHDGHTFLPDVPGTDTGRFLAAGAYDPYSRSRDGIVRRLFEELGLRVVKFEVSTGSGLMANHPVFPLDGEVMEREAAFAQEHGLVFVIDIGKLGSPSSQIQALRRLIRRHAGMKFVVCHLLAPKQNELEEMSAALDSLAGPNVWFDLASLQHNVRPDAPPYPVTRRFVARAVERVGAERLLFGTDTPQNLCSFRYEDLVDTIAQDPGLAAEQKQAILYQNARTVFWGE